MVKVLLSRRLFLAEALVLDDGHQLLAGRREQQVRPLNELGDIEELLVVLVEVESSLCLSKLNNGVHLLVLTGGLLQLVHLVQDVLTV